tara:strand:- start:1042 stop:1500 length:459 start_codon:yes stop_codon:yes gene_type:complete
VKKLFIILFSYFFFFNAHSAFIDITIDYKKNLECKFEKLILKNQKYNYKVFHADQLNEKKDIKIRINAIKSKELRIIGLSDFFTSSSNKSIYDTQILKNDTILIRAITKDNNYSESVFINKSSGEMVHEITSDIKSNFKSKEISFYFCDTKR